MRDADVNVISWASLFHELDVRSFLIVQVEIASVHKGHTLSPGVWGFTPLREMCDQLPTHHLLQEVLGDLRDGLCHVDIPHIDLILLGLSLIHI